jgi:hypothetical protein
LLPPRTLSILTNENDDKSHKFIINGDLKTPIAFSVDDPKMDVAIDAARQTLKDLSVNETLGFGATVPTYTSLYGPKNDKSLRGLTLDLARMAYMGWNLWTALFPVDNAKRQLVSDRLRLSDTKPAVIQVSRVKGSSLAFPWSFIYELPLSSDDAKYSYCRLLSDANWKEQIAAGLNRCPFEKQHAKKNLICPFGFWGFNHIIEQTPNMPEGRALPLWIKRAHEKPQLVMGISLDLDAGLTRAHKQELERKLSTIHLVPIECLKDVESALAEDKLELVYFYCHGRRKPFPGGKLQIPYIEVGKAEGIAPADITTWHDSDWSEGHWKDTSPLVFINGCHTAELTPELLVNFVDSFIGVYAAGVIGTEILLLQQVANEAAEQVFIAINEKDQKDRYLGVGEALRRMRLHFLGKGNLLGLAYTPYCSADLRLAN